VIGALEDIKVLRLLSATRDTLKIEMQEQKVSPDSISIEHFAKAKLSNLFIKNFLQANMLTVEPNPKTGAMPRMHFMNKK